MESEIRLGLQNLLGRPAGVGRHVHIHAFSLSHTHIKDKRMSVLQKHAKLSSPFFSGVIILGYGIIFIL